MDDLLRYYGVDWLGFALTLGSLHLLGNHRRAGFLLGAGSTVAWGAFSVMADSTATVVANSVFLCMNLRGWAKWRVAPGTNATEDGAAV
jgi:hypothetical protein